MEISSLKLLNYRNYKEISLDFCPGINLFYGENAQGKTNLVESIYYLSIGKAYRPAKDEQLCLWGNNNFYIGAKVVNNKKEGKIEVFFDKEKKPSKEYKVNGLKLERNEEISGLLTSVLFSPESLNIIKGAPADRRSFLDYDISQISLTYLQDLKKYKRMVLQRNNLLKKIEYKVNSINKKKEELEIWDDQLIEIGSKIIEKRLQTLIKINPLARLTHRKISEGKEETEIKYIFNKEKVLEEKEYINKEKIKELLKEERDKNLENDIRFAATGWGPHRDDLLIKINNIPVKQYGSQGQHRTAVLALKLAELEFFKGESSQYPILLLDDVLSELDIGRQNQLISFIKEKSIQCFITTTDAQNFNRQEKRVIDRFLVNRGKIEKN